MISCITDEFNEVLITNLHKTKKEIESLLNQLYLQVSITIELLKHLYQKTMLNYSLRKPKELESFKWIVDAKDLNITGCGTCYFNLEYFNSEYEFRLPLHSNLSQKK